MNVRATILCALAAGANPAAARAPRPDDAAPVELGRVRWQRDLDAALAASRSSGKPVFLLFQEVPG